MGIFSRWGQTNYLTHQLQGSTMTMSKPNAYIRSKVQGQRSNNMILSKPKLVMRTWRSVVRFPDPLQSGNQTRRSGAGDAKVAVLWSKSSGMAHFPRIHNPNASLDSNFVISLCVLDFSAHFLFSLSKQATAISGGYFEISGAAFWLAAPAWYFKLKFAKGGRAFRSQIKVGT